MITFSFTLIAKKSSTRTYLFLSLRLRIYRVYLLNRRKYYLNYLSLRIDI